MSCVRPPLCGASGMTRRPALRPIYARSCNSVHCRANGRQGAFKALRNRSASWVAGRSAV